MDVGDRGVDDGIFGWATSLGQVGKQTGNIFGNRG
jgi:hypothetical protein